MNKKVYGFIFSCAIFILSIFLIVFLSASEVPLVLNFHEKIVSLSSKWILIVCPALQLVCSSLNLKKHNQTTTAFLSLLSIIFVYQTAISLIICCCKTNFVVGEIFDVPLSAIVGLPLSIIFLFIAVKIKNAPFKSGLGIKTKFSTETEFLWTQTQLIANEKLKTCSAIMFLTAVAASFFRVFFFELIFFAILVIFSILIINHESKKIYLKYKKMEQRKNKLDENKNDNK